MKAVSAAFCAAMIVLMVVAVACGEQSQSTDSSDQQMVAKDRVGEEGPPPAGHRGGERFKEMDINGDGQISKDEWVTRHTEMFNKMDSDSNGFLTQEEMKSHRRQMRGSGRRRRGGSGSR